MKHSTMAARLSPILMVIASIGCADATQTPASDAAALVTGDAVLRVATLLDGRGGSQRDRDIVIVGDRIAAIVPRGLSSGVLYELSDLTVLPGLIDTHVHIGWHFDRSGRTQSREVEESAEESILFGAENAWVTLHGGVTTVQSLGSRTDVELRNAIARGVLPGPRVLTSIAALSIRTGDPEAIRERVRGLKESGADVIKIFASASIRDGGAPTMTQEQLDAACGEASAQGLRSTVHAHGPESARRSALAGCTTIEHGALLDRATLEVMAEHEMFFDPNIDLVFRNYLENKDRFLGIGNYNEEGFAQMEAALAPAMAAFQEALTVPGLRVVFGTDAVAGAHGRNAQELVYRVNTAGQPAMDAVVSATSLAAESLGMGDHIGTLAAGMDADIIGTVGNPALDIAALERVRFVMVGGRVVRNDPAR